MQIIKTMQNIINNRKNKNRIDNFTSNNFTFTRSMLLSGCCFKFLVSPGSPRSLRLVPLWYCCHCVEQQKGNYQNQDLKLENVQVTQHLVWVINCMQHSFHEDEYVLLQGNAWSLISKRQHNLMHLIKVRRR